MRFSVLFAVSFVALSSLAQAQTGLLVQLHHPAVARESAQASRERFAQVANDAQLANTPQRELSPGLHLLRFSTPQSAQAIDAYLRRLRLHPDVLHVEPDERQKPRRVPNDSSFSRQWYLQAPTTQAAAINAPAAWDLLTGDPVVVAVLDSGIRPHPDLVGKVLPGHDLVSETAYANDGNGRDADPTDPGDWVSAADKQADPASFGQCDTANSSWHGTFIAGLIGATSDNASGTAGVSWGAKILPVRVSGKCGALLSDLLDGMRWAAGLSVAGLPTNPNPARVINISFGGSTRCASSAYQPVIDEVTRAGALVVVAAGNEAGPPTRPADCANVLSVGAVRADGAKTSYSNLGAAVTLSAPGGSSELSGQNLLYGLLNTGSFGPTSEGFGLKQGTSFSAPLAAGLAALMLSANPRLSPAQLLAKMKLGTREFPFDASLGACTATNTGVCNCNVNTCGAGLLDAAFAVQQALIPTASIAPVALWVNGQALATSGPIDAGATVLLSGLPSLLGAQQSLQSVRWLQLSGPAASLANPNNITTTATLSGQAGVATFELRVTDTNARSSDATIAVTTAAGVVAPPPPSGGGGGAVSPWDVLALLALTIGVVWRTRRR